MVERRQVSGARRFAFYCGYLSMAAGAILLLSFSVTGIGPFTLSGIRASGARVLAGLGLVVLGFFLRRIGIRGLAGSLVILDPPKAKEDLEPWSRAAGGLVDAALSEVDAVKDIASGLSGKKADCPRCKAPNDPGARYCGRCGGELSTAGGARER